MEFPKAPDAEPQLIRKYRLFQKSVCIRARLNRPLKNSEKQIPRRLKSARDDKNKGLVTAQLKLRPFKTAEKVEEADPSRAEARSG